MEFFNRSRPGTAAQGVGVAQGGWRGCRIVVSLIDEMENQNVWPKGLFNRIQEIK